MAAAEFPLLELELQAFAKEVRRRARISLKASRTMWSIRSKWEPDGRTPIWSTVTKKPFKGNKMASGRLYQSIRFEIERRDLNRQASFFMEDYGEVVDQGRTPGSRWPPKEPIREWLSIKRIRMRDEGGKFAKGGREALQFLVRRKIGVFGIPPTFFFTHAYERTYEKWEPRLQKAWEADMQQILSAMTTRGLA